MSNLIEKDALKRKHCDSCACKSNCMGEGCKIYEARCLIADLPTIDAEPVRHGRWESWGYIFHGIEWKRCSECGKCAGVSYYGLLDGKIEMETPAVCGCCGAKMDLRTPTEAALDIADSVMMGGADNG